MMNIVICATRNMYPQMQQMLTMLTRTQSESIHFYIVAEDDLNVTDDNITIINATKYPKLINNIANNKSKWTYMCMARCYLAEILPDVDKLLYLDLDIHIDEDIKELWDIDISNYAVAGVIDVNAREHRFPYISNYSTYINSGVLLMNLKYFREHDITEQLHDLLSRFELKFPDQDAINIVCYDHIKFLSHKWNSGGACGYHDQAKIHHCSIIKPWEPLSRWFISWAQDYSTSGAKFSTYIC